MPWPSHVSDLVRFETHFDNRRVRCFADRPVHLDAMFQSALDLNASGDAVVAGDDRLSYSQLDQRVTDLSGRFSALGVAAGDRIALLIGNRVEFLYVVLAAIRLGAIAVPINVREQTPDLSYILNHCGATLLVHDGAVTERLPPADVLPELRHRFCTDGATATSAGLTTLLDGGAGTVPEPSRDEEDTAVILYTSGTTGLPKGARLTHLNIIHSVMHFSLCMGLDAGERSLVAVPASHVTGLVAQLFTMIRVAGCSVLLESFDAGGFLALAARERITHAVLVPAMFNLCLLRADFAQYDLSAWRIGGYGGAPMPEATIEALAERLTHLVLINAYGSTEVTSPATIVPPGLGASRADSVGICVPCGDIRVVDDSGTDVADGVHGEIWISGPMVVPGYWEAENQTEEAFAEGYWKSGDVGSRDSDGFIHLHDRKKDMIIRGGYNVYSAEVENVLSRCTGVIECAAVGVPDPVLGEKIRLFVFRTSSEPDSQAVKRFCAERLADYKVPDFVTFTADPLPRNANGKLLKQVLRAL